MTPDEQTRLIESAPRLPAAFFGTVEFVYEHGRVVVARITQTVKPARPERTA